MWKGSDVSVGDWLMTAFEVALLLGLWFFIGLSQWNSRKRSPLHLLWMIPGGLLLFFCLGILWDMIR